jgi:hypothetical protein
VSGLAVEVTGHRRVICVLTGPVGLRQLDALARLHLHARRHRAGLWVRGGEPQLAALLGLVGLALRSQPGRQPEALEDLRAQEVVHVRDVPA